MSGCNEKLEQVLYVPVLAISHILVVMNLIKRGHELKAGTPGKPPQVNKLLSQKMPRLGFSSGNRQTSGRECVPRTGLNPRGPGVHPTAAVQLAKIR
jgi:hypothetical protein